MVFLLRVYIKNEIRELEVVPDRTYKIGGASQDDLCIDGIGLPKQCFSIQATKEGWMIESRSKAHRQRLGAAAGVQPFEKILVLDEQQRFAITVYQSGPDKSRLINVSREEQITVGRSSACGISLKSRQISGQHVELQRRRDGWYFRDLQSANGTYFNGKQVDSGRIGPDDVLSIGFCRLILTDELLTVIFSGPVVVNLSSAQESHGIDSIDDAYPYLFKQSPRLQEELPVETVELQSPPAIGGAPSISWLNVLLMPVLTVAVMLAVCFFITGVMTMLFFSVPMTIIGAVMSVFRYKSQKKKYAATQQLRLDKYDQYLDEQVAHIDALVKEQRRIRNEDFPSVAQCVHLAEEPERTLWDRRYRDVDFMSLRVGEGTLPSTVTVKAPKQMLSLEVDALASRPSQIAEMYAQVEDCPITIDLGRHPTCGIIGERSRCVQLGKNLIVQAAAHLSYEDLRIVVLCDAQERDEWTFCRWIPHCFDDTRSFRYFADTRQQAGKLLGGLDDILAQREQENGQTEYSNTPSMHRPFYLFVCASAELVANHPVMRRLAAGDCRLQAGAIFLFNRLDDLPKECHYIAELGRTTCEVYEKDHASARQKFSLDQILPEQYDHFARSLAPLRVEPSGKTGTLPTNISFLQGYQARTAQMLNLEQNWSHAFPEQGMAVPIGVKGGGDSFFFDIHEKQHGPHGLVAGMTGSGKSEMVQTWILSMAVRFPPSAVSFVLIDFKGTGLLLPFRNLPHLAGTISDLDTNIGRNLIALENELNRRKALLDQYQVSNISAYRKLLNQGIAKESLPYLMIVIDEFAEFKARFPDFMQAVNSVFAIGRTLGVHMILLTQKPANIVDDKMNANTRFRWCLKVANSTDSRDMLHHPDAAKITNPGRAFVQVGEDEVFEEIQSCWSGAPYNPYRDLTLQRSSTVSVVDLYGNRICYEPEKTTGYRSEKTEIEAVVEYIDTFARKNQIDRARTIWTSKLPTEICLKDILQVAFDGERWGQTEHALRPVIGLLDDPRSQSQYPLYLNLTEDGHTAVYGSPGTGKTTLLHTAILSLALSCSPDLVHMYLLDFGGGSLNLFRDLPHVGGVAMGGDGEKIHKLSVMLTNELSRRKKLLSELGLVNIASYQEATGETLPYIVLFLDHFAPVLELYPDLDAFFQTIVREGSSCGMYLVVTAGTQSALNYRISQNIKFSIALRMPDKNDYATIVGRTNGLEPENLPGRGLVRGNPPLEFQTALPMDGGSEVERVAKIRSLAALMNSKWSGNRARPIPVMPEVVRICDYPCDGIFLGLACQDITPRALDLQTTQFLLISTEEDDTHAARPVFQQAVEKLCPTQVIGYGNLSGLTGIQPLSAAAFDQAIGDLMPVLQERKTRAAEAPLSISEHPNILILIDGLQDCFEQISNDTARRLFNIVTLGAGLHVVLAACDQRKGIGRLYHGGDAFTMRLVKQAPALLIGDSVQAHNAFTVNLPHSERSATMGRDEAYLIQSGKAEKIKLVQQ